MAEERSFSTEEPSSAESGTVLSRGDWESRQVRGDNLGPSLAVRDERLIAEHILMVVVPSHCFLARMGSLTMVEMGGNKKMLEKRPLFGEELGLGVGFESWFGIWVRELVWRRGQKLARGEGKIWARGEGEARGRKV